MGKSSIGWTDETWNPVTGCSHVSEGCDHCYAEELTLQKAEAGLWDAPVLPWTPENAEQNVILHPERVEQPLHWKKPRMVFVNSMSDMFHPRVPTEFLVETFNVMAQCPQHTFQILTKRPKRMRDFIGGAADCEHGWLTHNGDNPESYKGTGLVLIDKIGWPLPNVWLGTSIESREYVGRADLLRETPASVRFISAEPLLGPLVGDRDCNCGVPATDGAGQHAPDCQCLDADLDLTSIDWLIVGGESGPVHRPMSLDWVRDLRDACEDSPTRLFYKQPGGRFPSSGTRDLDGRTWDEFPDPVEPVVSQGALL